MLFIRSCLWQRVQVRSENRASKRSHIHFDHEWIPRLQRLIIRHFWHHHFDKAVLPKPAHDVTGFIRCFSVNIGSLWGFKIYHKVFLLIDLWGWRYNQRCTNRSVNYSVHFSPLLVYRDGSLSSGISCTYGLRYSGSQLSSLSIREYASYCHLHSLAGFIG